MIICHHRHLSHLSQDPDSISRIFLEQLFSSSDTDALIPSTPSCLLCVMKRTASPPSTVPLRSLTHWQFGTNGVHSAQKSKWAAPAQTRDLDVMKKYNITKTYTWWPRVYFLEELCTRSGRMVRKRSARLTDGSPFLRQINCIHQFFSSIFQPHFPHPSFLSSKFPP